MSVMGRVGWGFVNDSNLCELLRWNAGDGGNQLGNYLSAPLLMFGHQFINGLGLDFQVRQRGFDVLGSFAEHVSVIGGEMDGRLRVQAAASKCAGGGTKGIADGFGWCG